MNHYTDHDGKAWTIDQTNSELSQDLYADLVAAVDIARQLQAKCERLERTLSAELDRVYAENRRLWAEIDRLELVS